MGLDFNDVTGKRLVLKFPIHFVLVVLALVCTDSLLVFVPLITVNLRRVQRWQTGDPKTATEATARWQGQALEDVVE